MTRIKVYSKQKPAFPQTVEIYTVVKLNQPGLITLPFRKILIKLLYFYLGRDFII